MSKQTKQVLPNEARATSVCGQYRVQVNNHPARLIDASSMRAAANTALKGVSFPGTVRVTDWVGNENTYAIGSKGRVGERLETLHVTPPSH